MCVFKTNSIITNSNENVWKNRQRVFEFQWRNNSRDELWQNKKKSVKVQVSTQNQNNEKNDTAEFNGKTKNVPFVEQETLCVIDYQCGYG